MIGGFHQARRPRYAFNKTLFLLSLSSLSSRLDAKFCDASQNEQMEKNARIQLLENKNKYQVKDSQISVVVCAWGINALDLIWQAVANSITNIEAAKNVREESTSAMIMSQMHHLDITRSNFQGLLLMGVFSTSAESTRLS